MWIWSLRSNRRKDSRGFTLAEVVVAIAIMAVTMTGIALLMNKATRVKRSADTLVDIKKIESALETTYRRKLHTLN